jgi:hypothetical protein
VKIGANETQGRPGQLHGEREAQPRRDGGRLRNREGQTEQRANVTGNDTETVGAVRVTIAGLGMPSIPGPKDIASVVVPHTLGAAAQDISPGLAGGALSDLFSGASLADVARSSADGIATAAIGGAISGDIGGSVKDAVGLPSSTPDLGAALQKMASPENLMAMGKELAMNAIFKGSILRDTRGVYTRMIGGAQVSVAGGTIMNGANFLFTELIGGLKATLSAKASIMQSASKFLVHNVGGLVLRKSKEDMSMSSKRSVVTVGATTTMHSDEKVELRGKVIEIEGQSSVKLTSGGVTIELTPDKATISGSLRTKSGNSIKISGNPDKLTA